MSADQLVGALAAEHAAIFGYGVAGAHLDKSGRANAQLAENAHRNRRDALLLRLTAAQATPPAAQAAYALPFAVTDRDSALKLVLALEEHTAAVWRSLLASATTDERRLALDALTDCAVRATRWRQAAGVLPPVVPFPGTS